MPKRRSDERGDRCKARPTRRNLYLVLDDWSLGYSIRKIDLKAYAPRAGLQPLPTPIFQLEAPQEFPMSFTAAFGSKIIAMNPMQSMVDRHGRTIAPIFDVCMRSLMYCPQPNDVLSYPVFIPISDDKLLALCGQSLELLNRPEKKPSGVWSWRKLLDLPFDSRSVASYAVHPDGQTIFISVGEFTPEACTFSFCMDESSSEGPVLTGRADWMLPFKGRSYFVSELDAWVGLSGSDHIGYLCACPVMAASDSSIPRCAPSWKFSKERVYTKNPAEMHIGATLVYMGSESEFCLVECVSVDYSYVCEVIREQREEEDDARSRRYLLRLTTFSLVYDENGDLTTGNTCRLRYYDVAGAVSSLAAECPVAFYL